VSSLMRWDDPFAVKKQRWGEPGRSAILLEFADVINRAMDNGRGTGIGVTLNAVDWRSLKNHYQQRLKNKTEALVFQTFVAFLVWRHVQLTKTDFRIGLSLDDDQENAIRYYRLLWRT